MKCILLAGKKGDLKIFFFLSYNKSLSALFLWLQCLKVKNLVTKGAVILFLPQVNSIFFPKKQQQFLKHGMRMSCSVVSQSFQEYLLFWIRNIHKSVELKCFSCSPSLVILHLNLLELKALTELGVLTGMQAALVNSEWFRWRFIQALVTSITTLHLNILRLLGCNPVWQESDVL